MKYLIVVDMKDVFITGSLGTKAAEAVLPKVIEKVNLFINYYLLDINKEI